MRHEIRSYSLTLHFVMPKIPKWLGDTMEVVFRKMVHPATVVAVEYIPPRLKRVVLGGDLAQLKYIPGNVVEFRINDREFRHYTLSGFDPETGQCEVLFYLHERGCGSRWAAQLQVGDQVKMMGPGGRIRYNRELRHHFFFGDETSVGLVQCLQQEALSRGQEYMAVVELEKRHYCWLDAMGIKAEAVGKSYENPAGEAIALVASMVHFEPWLQGMFYLTGRARSIQAMRRYLLSRGVASGRIRCEPYWAEGKQGL